ncbi:MAG: DUF1501 domain-containing protein [Brumimicrobium sp.]
MKRRNFVKNVSLASFGVPFVFNNMKFETISKKLFNVPKNMEDRVLVIIRLNGGNDGLNTIVPIDQYDNLIIQRTNVILPENDLIPIIGDNGMHPVMTGMANMINDGNLSIIQNVGYPEQNRSHFRSMDIWTSGMMDPAENTGWLGRHFSVDHPDYPDGYPNSQNEDPFAISMGYEVSATCQGLMANFSHSVVDPFQVSNLPNSGAVNDGTYYGSHMEYLHGIIEQTNEYGDQINDAANAGNNLSTLYDANSDLAEQLKNVALMISGGLETKVYILNVNGFDTHDNQVVNGDTVNGVHANLMKEVSDAIYAFQDDMKLLGLEKRVAGMTFSEFGRQIASNGSDGTDHGDAAPLFLFGDCLETPLYGQNPTIPNQVTNQAGLPMDVDFRDVYASILRYWFGVDDAEVQSMFEHNVTYHSIIGGCNLSVEEQNKNKNSDNYSLVYPNPCGSKATLKMNGQGGHAKIEIFDMQGRLMKSVFEGNLTLATHHIPLEVDELKKGTYSIKIQQQSGVESVQMIKMRN